MKRLLLLFSIVLLFAVVGCSPSEKDIEKAVERGDYQYIEKYLSNPKYRNDSNKSATNVAAVKALKKFMESVDVLSLPAWGDEWEGEKYTEIVGRPDGISVKLIDADDSDKKNDSGFRSLFPYIKFKIINKSKDPVKIQSVKVVYTYTFDTPYGRTFLRQNPLFAHNIEIDKILTNDDIMIVHSQSKYGMNSPRGASVLKIYRWVIVETSIGTLESDKDIHTRHGW